MVCASAHGQVLLLRVSVHEDASMSQNCAALFSSTDSGRGFRPARPRRRRALSALQHQ